MQRVTVRIRVNGYGGDAFVPCGANDSNGDLTAVGDQYLGERAGGLFRFC
jgi:hypothetical protein